MRIIKDKRGFHYVAPWNDAPLNFVRCNSCGRAWDDDMPTGWTPAPAGRCPFEHLHKAEPHYSTQITRFHDRH